VIEARGEGYDFGRILNFSTTCASRTTLGEPSGDTCCSAAQRLVRCLFGSVLLWGISGLSGLRLVPSRLLVRASNARTSLLEIDYIIGDGGQFATGLSFTNFQSIAGPLNNTMTTRTNGFTGQEESGKDTESGSKFHIDKTLDG